MTAPVMPAAGLVAATWEPLDSLVEWDANPRDNEAAVAEVAESIRRWGFGAPIVARAADRRVIAGHTRIRAARALGLAAVPVRFLDLSDAEARALSLADNRLGEIATWDDEALHEALRALAQEDVDLSGLGWSDAEMAALIVEADTGVRRDLLDRYYTPPACALACLRDAAPFLPEPRRIVEPSVGAGAWVDAARELWPNAVVVGYDVDPDAAGLARCDERHVGDWLELGGECDLLLGNPPYKLLAAWLARSVERAPSSLYLLRGTALGSDRRAAWHEANPPARTWTVLPRPVWEGPSAREQTDSSDPVLALWLRGLAGTHRWVRWRREER